MCHLVWEELAETAALQLALTAVIFAEVHCTVAAEPESQGRLAVIRNSVQSSHFPLLCSARTSGTNSDQA